MIHGRRQGNNPVAAHAAESRLETGDATIRSRPGDRAARLRSQGAQAHTASHSRRRAAARPTGSTSEIPRIARERGIEAGKLGRHGFTEKYSAGLPKAPNDRGIPSSNALFPELRTGRGRPIEDIENVLDTERNTVQRTAILTML